MPPRITRQEPPKPQPTTFPQGSVLATAIPVSSLRESYVKLCIYGRNRSGKTTLAAQHEKPLLIISSEPDTNGGALSISNMEGIVISRVAVERLKGDTVWGSNKVVAIANELAVNNPFKTVVLDTVTSLQELVGCELLGLNSIPDSMAWGTAPDGHYQRRADKLRSVVRPLLNLNNCNLVILAQEKDHNAPEDRGGKSRLMHTMQQGSFMAPALGATNAQWLQDNCNYIIQILESEVMEDILIPQTDLEGKPLPDAVQQVGTGKRQRHLRLLYHPNFAAGGRWQFDKGIPEFVTASTPKGLYEAMAKFIPSLKLS